MMVNNVYKMTVTIDNNFRKVELAKTVSHTLGLPWIKNSVFLTIVAHNKSYPVMVVVRIVPNILSRILIKYHVVKKNVIHIVNKS